MMSDTTWTTQRIDELTRHHADGHSATAIGKLMNLTRNSVCGKISRLQLPTPTRRQPQIPKRKAVRTKRALHLVPAAPPAPPVSQTVFPGSNHPVSLLDLGPNDCKDIIGNTETGAVIYCGNTRCLDHNGRRSPYCTEHHRITHNVVPR